MNNWDGEAWGWFWLGAFAAAVLIVVTVTTGWYNHAKAVEKTRRIEARYESVRPKQCKRSSIRHVSGSTMTTYTVDTGPCSVVLKK